MGAIATLNRKRVTDARVQVPAWGLWFAEVSIDGESSMQGAASLVIADLTLKGTILSGGAEKGRSHFRIVGGAGGWGKSIPKKSYANDAGVKLVNVLRDAASSVGETLDPSTDSSTRVGSAFVRPEGPASRVLELLRPSGWYVGEDGITHIGARPAKALNTKAARVVPIDRARGTVTIASETIAALTPGVVVDELEAVDVEHKISEEGLRTTLFGKLGARTSRELSALRTLLDQLEPNLRFASVREYRVQAMVGNRLNLAPVRVSTGFPELKLVPVRPGVAGAKCLVSPGMRVLVAFIDADPSRPTVVGFEDADGQGFAPISISFGNGFRPVAAFGDMAGPFPITATGVKVLVP